MDRTAAVCEAGNSEFSPVTRAATGGLGREVLAHAVRSNLSAAPSLGELRQALSIIADVLNSGHFEISGAV